MMSALYFTQTNRCCWPCSAFVWSCCHLPALFSSSGATMCVAGGNSRKGYQQPMHRAQWRPLLQLHLPWRRATLQANLPWRGATPHKLLPWQRATPHKFLPWKSATRARWPRHGPTTADHLSNAALSTVAPRWNCSHGCNEGPPVSIQQTDVAGKTSRPTMVHILVYA
jgi:hypothetical protein